VNGVLRIRHKGDLAVIFSDLAAICGYDQGQLAADAGCYQSQISEWLRGTRSMDVPSIIRVAGALGYDLALIPREDTQ
jgi:hypothetical protein